jgi:class 3 adenylate cyclase
MSEEASQGGTDLENTGQAGEPRVKAALVSEQPGSLGKEHSLAAGVVTVGRGQDNDIVLESPRVSRYHARLDWTGSMYVLEDLGSKNGTWLNHRRLEGPTPLNDGDMVRFGDLWFAFKVQSGGTETMPCISPVPHETVTIMFTDLEGHTDLFESLGSEAAYQLLDDHLSIMKTQIVRHGGRVVKTEGDGLIAGFSSVRQAVDCAIHIQQAVSKLRLSAGREPLPVRIGINSGEALKEGEDLIGLAVVKAERIMRLASGGHIYLSQVSRGLLGPASGVLICSKGWCQLKGISRKERVFEVRWRED